MNNNILKNTKVYLAGNLEFSDNSKNWRDYLTTELNKLNIKSLSPIKQMFVNQIDENDEVKQNLFKMREEERYDEVCAHMKSVVQKDLRLIDLSDFVIINLEISKPTFGTVHELVLVNLQKKPVFLSVGDKKKCPLWIMGMLPHKYIYNNVEEILEMVKNIDSGEVFIDSDRWRILIERLR